MSKEKRRVPKLRFPGFTEDWEQRKLSDILKVNSGKDYKHLDQGNIPVYGTGGYMLSVNESLSNIDAIGIGRKGTIDKPQYLKAPFWTVDTLFYLTALDHHSILFLYYLMQLIPWKKYDESTGVPSLSKTTIENISGYVPLNSKEEELISTLFNQLDKSITLHQRKLEHLNLKKKALLQKLFPKNGDRYPELRFPGFTDAWEQRKADYIFKSVTDKGYPELPVLSASQELGMVYRDRNGIDIQHNKKNETSYKRVLPGQFVIHLRSFQGGFAYSEVEGITSPAYIVMSFKNSSEQYGLFWKHVFKSETFIKRLETITYGIRDGRSISFSDFKSLILQYPSYSEQKLIGDSIALIERGITLHQRKLDHLQLQKKALLQQMFV